jgi:hypothetical protein
MDSDVRMVTYTAETVSRLRARYGLAVDNNEEQFEFDGGQYLTAYVKYLLQYLEDQINDK